jgi:aminopeptidase N
LDHPNEGLLAHELAHQWFGNYVTIRDWNHSWLNEGFAVYFQGLWHENNLGADDFYYRDVKPNQDRYLAAWADGSRRPLVPKEYSDADALFDSYTYQRSGAVLHMLRYVLGEENWWRGVRHFLTKYAYQPVETEQFQKAIEESSGQSLQWFFDQWVYRMGHPVFNISQVYDPATRTLALTVKQEQQLDPQSKEPQQRFFRMPVEIKIATANRERTERVQIEPQEEKVFRFKVDSAPQFTSFDSRGVLIKELHFTKTTSELLYQLANDSDLPGRLWALNQLGPRLADKATTDKEKQEIANALALALAHDKFWGLRLQAATALERAPGKAAQPALRLALKDQNAAVRARALTSLSTANDTTLAGTYQDMLGDPSYEVMKAAALALGKTRSPNAYGALEKLLAVPSWRDTVRAAALRGLAMLSDPRSKELALKYSQESYPIPVRAGGVALLGAVGRGDPRAYPLVLAAFQQAFVMDNQELGFAASEALVNVCDARGLEFLAAVAKKVADNPQGQAFISDLSQRLQKCVTEEARKVSGKSQD